MAALYAHELARIEASEDPAEWALAEKRARALGVFARAAKNIADLSLRAENCAPSDTQDGGLDDVDDQMKEPDDLDDPARVAQLRSQVERDLNCIAAAIEQKRIPPETVPESALAFLADSG
ncbi:MAG: hypothetical protein ACXWVO_03395 [Caulobacteraceae bacterium]